MKAVPFENGFYMDYPQGDLNPCCRNENPVS